MSEVRWKDVPPLRRPLLLMAFEGLFDAAESATEALAWVRDRNDAAEVAEIDPETYFNFNETRPMVRFDDDGKRVIDWPTTRVWACTTGAERDLLLMTGIEPQLRWRSFADDVLEIVRRSGAEMAVTVGAMVAMVPHTRPFPITGSAANPELARRLGLDRPSYQGPTGVVGVVHDRLDRSGVPVMSLRSSVPHYVPGPPNPKATRALLRRIQQTTGVPTSYEELDGAVKEWAERVDQAVQSDDESRDYVARLERQVDSNEDLLPSGDALAAELEAFLRDHSSGSAEDPAADNDEDTDDES
ncbi:MAG: hypothetical protein ACI8TP_000381 [Acidimicrobiales bacterium]|jgi:proteasome assembly chaperone (PAC2) family protein